MKLFHAQVCGSVLEAISLFLVHEISYTVYSMCVLANFPCELPGAVFADYQLKVTTFEPTIAQERFCVPKVCGWKVKR